MERSQNREKNKDSSIPTEDQTNQIIGKNPSLRNFMNLSKGGASPMIIKKGDETPPRVSIGDQEILFAYIHKNKIPFDEGQIPDEILKNTDRTISYANGKFTFS